MRIFPNGLETRVRFIEGNIPDPGLLKDTFRGADGIFHQAGIPSVPRSIRDPVDTNDVEPCTGLA